MALGTNYLRGPVGRPGPLQPFPCRLLPPHGAAPRAGAPVPAALSLPSIHTCPPGDAPPPGRPSDDVTHPHPPPPLPLSDPHPGNLIRTPDGKVCVLDFGLVTEVTPEQRIALVEYISHLTTQV